MRIAIVSGNSEGPTELNAFDNALYEAEIGDVTVFFDENDKPVLSADIVNKVADLVAEHGTNIWFELTDAQLCETPFPERLSRL